MYRDGVMQSVCFVYWFPLRIFPLNQAKLVYRLCALYQIYPVFADLFSPRVYKRFLLWESPLPQVCFLYHYIRQNLQADYILQN